MQNDQPQFEERIVAGRLLRFPTTREQINPRTGQVEHVAIATAPGKTFSLSALISVFGPDLRGHGGVAAALDHGGFYWVEYSPDGNHRYSLAAAAHVADLAASVRQLGAGPETMPTTAGIPSATPTSYAAANRLGVDERERLGIFVPPTAEEQPELEAEPPTTSAHAGDQARPAKWTFQTAPVDDEAEQ
jgi:hypothetical protein